MPTLAQSSGGAWPSPVSPSRRPWVRRESETMLNSTKRKWTSAFTVLDPAQNQLFFLTTTILIYNVLK